MLAHYLTSSSALPLQITKYPRAHFTFYVELVLIPFTAAAYSTQSPVKGTGAVSSPLFPFSLKTYLYAQCQDN